MEQIRLEELLLLPVPCEEEEDLGLKRVPFRIAVEVLQEGVFLELLQNDLGPQRFTEHAAQRGLPGADAPLDRDIFEVGLGDERTERFLRGHTGSRVCVREVME